MPTVFLEKAKANLAVAEYCFNNGFYEASANRAYCAAFQAAITALAAQGIRNDKNEHKWVQASFSRELIHRRKIYPSRLSSFLSDLFRVRNEADYSAKLLGKTVALRQLTKARDFSDTIIQETGS